jgi:hypothetical protein
MKILGFLVSMLSISDEQFAKHSQSAMDPRTSLPCGVTLARNLR